MTESGITFTVDATQPSHQRLKVAIQIQAPFSKSKLTLSFPRWVPGSYFLREPIQHVTNLSVSDDSGNALTFSRKEVDSIVISDVQSCKSVTVEYQLLAVDLSVRSNHFDESHLHMMPPFTWFLPTSGIEDERMNFQHSIQFKLPKSWTVTTQLDKIELEENNDMNIHIYSAKNRDDLLDGIAECNSNSVIETTIDGIRHTLDIWDAGGKEPHPVMVERFIHDMKSIVKEHHALFGIIEEDYHTILHLTGGPRGGLEHMNSQTSMVPRTSLQPGNIEEYRDLVSLFSHEYLHKWNVKRLRPKKFLDYDLQREVNSDLLWWFEGTTSWLGDIICLQSGAWSKEDYFADMKRKLKRHHSRSGIDSQSLCEASHEAWIHLYRGHAYSRETQISYYLEGELSIFALDAELRKRSNGESGVCDLMAELYHKHNINVEQKGDRGIQYRDIRKALTSLRGGRRLGTFLDELTTKKGVLDLDQAFALFGIPYESSKAKERKDGTEKIAWKEFEQGWLGINLRNQNNKLLVSSHLQGSPVREHLQVGDEVIAINDQRITSSEQLKTALKGNAEEEITILYSRSSIIQEVNVTPINEPKSPTVSACDGNRFWKATTRTLQKS
ncbi:PDZ domain-containing protein [Candidatus Poseidoniales archaeon]|nr:PDZ domain-containing protein [Candidatus Poseidoniales archaeon]|tara:strand:+ start:607 stop:2442 length:1836 start_codon:yes stop_codon:yes gene_type:complete